MHDLKTIRQVATQHQVTLRALRHWEEMGLLAPARSGRTRLYTPEQVRRVKQIKQWSTAGIPLSEIKAALDRGAGRKRLLPMLEKLREESLQRLAAIYRATEDLRKAA